MHGKLSVHLRSVFRITAFLSITPYFMPWVSVSVSWPFAVYFQSSVERNPYVIQDCFGL